MRFSYLHTLCLSLALLGAVSAAFAAPASTIEKPAAAPLAAQNAKVTIAPHRAIYDMALTSVKNGSNIADVGGTMIFEWADSCDGWAVQQNLHLHFNYAQGDVSEVASNEVTWESKDGKRYNFNIRRLNDGKETENYRGKAVLTGKEDDKAVYTTPEGKSVVLTPETIFPSTHTEMIIAKALAGEHFFTKRVFDGTDEGGSDDVSVFISPPQPQRFDAGDNLSSNPLLDVPAYPVHMAFFKIDDPSGEPDYEMDLTLLSNGISRTMRIDYGDFIITGTLKAIEALPAPHC